MKQQFLACTVLLTPIDLGETWIATLFNNGISTKYKNN